MSYTIEYARKVFKIPKGTLIPAGFSFSEHKYYEDKYFVFTKSGCSNIEPRPQSWNLMAKGWHLQVNAAICARARLTEGGELKLVTGNTKPEAYLKLYGNEIANAATFSVQELKSFTGVYGGYICLGNKHDQPAESVSRKINELKEWVTPYGEYFDYFRYDFSFTTEEHFRAFIHFQSLIDTMGGFSDIQSYQDK
jgi:hypothetical protein